MPDLRMNASELETFLRVQFGEASEPGLKVARLSSQEIEVHHPIRPAHLRAGGTVSGPTLMTLADTATYLLLMAQLGEGKHAVTTSLHIDFLRRPTGSVLYATGRLLKLGKRLAVCRVDFRTDTSQEPVAQASVTYALPSPKLSR